MTDLKSEFVTVRRTMEQEISVRKDMIFSVMWLNEHSYTAHGDIYRFFKGNEMPKGCFTVSSQSGFSYRTLDNPLDLDDTLESRIRTNLGEAA